MTQLQKFRSTKAKKTYSRFDKIRDSIHILYTLTLQVLLKTNVKDPVQATIIQERLALHNLGESVKHGILRLRIHTLVPVSQKTIAETQMVNPLHGAILQIQTSALKSATSLTVVQILFLCHS